MSRTGLPLAGRRVVVTRSRAQASSLVDRLTALGAIAVELPVIAIEDAADGGAGLAAAASRLTEGAYEWVAFTSANAVGRLLDALGPRRPPEGVRWAAVGSGTARALTAGGFPPDLVPTSSVSDQLAEAFPSAPATGGAVLFPRAETVRGALAEGLGAKGWSVDEVVAYRTVAGAPDARAVAEARGAEAVAFTSSSTVDRTIELLGAEGVPPVVVTIGPVTSASARAAGLAVAVEATEATIDGLAAAVVSALGGPDQRHQQQ
jgi:uroporphyrinogen III methyltransferase / synthase